MRGQHRWSLPWLNLFAARRRIQAQVLEVFCTGCSESSEDDYSLAEREVQRLEEVELVERVEG